jgi:hypothetical protein
MFSLAKVNRVLAKQGVTVAKGNLLGATAQEYEVVAEQTSWRTQIWVGLG